MALYLSEVSCLLCLQPLGLPAGLTPIIVLEEYQLCYHWWGNMGEKLWLRRDSNPGVPDSQLVAHGS